MHLIRDVKQIVVCFNNKHANVCVCGACTCLSVSPCVLNDTIENDGINETISSVKYGVQAGSLSIITENTRSYLCVLNEPPSRSSA